MTKSIAIKITAILSAFLCCCGSSANAESANNGIDVSFYSVPLVCPAAPHIGCGSKAKPVLLDLEADSNIREAWLNRAGTIVAVVWKNVSAESWHTNIANAIFQKHGIEGDVVAEKDYAGLLKDFEAKKDWLRGAQVDTLSEEEAGVIAQRMIDRVDAKVSLTKEKSDMLKSEISSALAAVFTSAKRNGAKMSTASKKNMENSVLKAAGEYMNNTEIAALRDAIALGVCATKDEKKAENAKAANCSPKGSPAGCCSTHR